MVMAASYSNDLTACRAQAREGWCRSVPSHLVGEGQGGVATSTGLAATPLPALPTRGRGIAFGLEVPIALVRKEDSEGDSRIAEGVGCATSGRLFDPCRTRGPRTRDTIFWKFCLLRWRLCCAGQRRARTWRNSASPKKGCCGWVCGLSLGYRATIRSAAYSDCSIRVRSKPHSGASWRRLQKPMASNSREWWRSTAKLCAAPTNAADKQRR